MMGAGIRYMDTSVERIVVVGGGWRWWSVVGDGDWYGGFLFRC